VLVMGVSWFVWRTEVLIEDPAAPGRIEMFVDAKNGQAYRSDELLDDLGGSGIGVLGDPQMFEIAERRGRFYLEDAQSGSPPQKTYLAGSHLPGTEVSSDRPDRWDEGGLGSGAAVDAHAFVAATYNYY